MSRVAELKRLGSSQRKSGRKEGKGELLLSFGFPTRFLLPDWKLAGGPQLHESLGYRSLRRSVRQDRSWSLSDEGKRVVG